MTTAEMTRRVTLIRACLHVRAHYLDENGNRRCYGCDAFVKPRKGVDLLDAPRDGGA